MQDYKDSLLDCGRRIVATTLTLFILTLAGGCAGHHSGFASDPAAMAEKKAVDFLTREVPAWSRDNHCYSCHNNGDSARALFAAIRHGYRIPAVALTDTLGWVQKLGQWSQNKGDPGFSDQRLANIQFSASLVAAFRAGLVKDRGTLLEAARLVAADQDADGAWHIDRQNSVGSPATWGTTLATGMARRILLATDGPQYRNVILMADEWLRQVRPINVSVAAALLLAMGDEPENSHFPYRAESLALIRRAKTSSGGWGPYVDSPTEAFDTALVLLGLSGAREEPGVVEMIRRGRGFLVVEQLSDGSWPATTRPSGNQSYAQQMSTTAWATLALLATRNEDW